MRVPFSALAELEAYWLLGFEIEEVSLMLSRSCEKSLMPSASVPDSHAPTSGRIERQN